jgi:hypothetical protein
VKRFERICDVVGLGVTAAVRICEPCEHGRPPLFNDVLRFIALTNKDSVDRRAGSGFMKQSVTPKTEIGRSRPSVSPEGAFCERVLGPNPV